MQDSVASRYAIALLGVARDEKKVVEYNNEVEELINIFEQNPDLVRILKDYGLSTQEKKDTLDLLFKGKVFDYILNFMYIVVDNKRGSLILDMLKEFNRLALKELNIKRGYVYTTISLTASEMKKLEKKVSSILNANVTLTNKIDTQIMGGFKIQVEDYIIDDSVSSRLNKLKETLSIKKGE